MKHKHHRQKTREQIIEELNEQKQNDLIMEGMLLQRMTDLTKLKDGYGWEPSEIKVFDDMNCSFLEAYLNHELMPSDITDMIDSLKEIGIDVCTVSLLRERK